MVFNIIVLQEQHINNINKKHSMYLPEYDDKDVSV